jgi:hypothetical protein
LTPYAEVTVGETVAVVLSLLLVAATVTVHYEFLRLSSALTSRLSIPGRAHVLFIIGIVFVAHFAEVGLYTVAYYACDRWWQLGRIDGDVEGDIADFFYFSITTFTTLGIGDVQPRGPMRLIAGVESLNGLVLIGWSASFTYLSMERFWQEGTKLASTPAERIDTRS